MAKQFNEWLDEFIENGFDSNNITHWPEEGSEPVVVEELPQEPVFGKVYAIETSGETTYYTTDVNGNWINLTEGAQTGGIVDVEYLDEATAEPNVTYNVTIGDGTYGPGLYYSIHDETTGGMSFIYLDGIGCVDGNIVLDTYLGSCGLISRYEGDAAFINISGGQQSSDTYYPYDYTESSGVVNILDAIYPYSAEQYGAFYLSSDGVFNTPSDNTATVLVPQGDSESPYYEPAFVSSGEEIIVYDNGDGIHYSSGANEIYWKYYSSNGTYDFNSLQDSSYIPDMLTDVFGSHGRFSSGSIYYPLNQNDSQHYEWADEAFVALISTHATAYDGGSGIEYWSDLMYEKYVMEPGKAYQVVESSGEYSLQEAGGAGYFETEDAALQALNLSADHEVSSGDIFSSIYYPQISSGGRYSLVNNTPYGYWLRGSLGATDYNPDGQPIYGYDPIEIYNERTSTSISDSDLCKLINVAKTHQDPDYGQYDSNVFWTYANRIYYPAGTSNTYQSTQWNYNTGLIYITGYDNSYSARHTQLTTMDNSHLYYQYYRSVGSGTITQIDSVALPVNSTPVQVTINGVSYTITKNQ